jgi:hypothetical protein
MEASDWNETSELKYLTHSMPLPSPPDDVAAPAEQQAAQVIIDFSQVGTAGPFPVVNGRVSLPDATMLDLVHMLWPTYEAQAQQAAPQQEAQEPVAWLNPWRADQVTTDYDAYGERGIPLYTAPQPAPAPLSEMSYKKRKAIQEDEQIGASDAWFLARHNMLDTLDRRNVFRAGFDRGWNAALAAQGEKDAE